MRMFNRAVSVGAILAAVLVLAVFSMGCQNDPPNPNGPTTQIVTQNVIIGGQPSPSPGSGGTLPEGSNTPVFTVGTGSCPGGGIAMPNGGTLKLGCTVWVTCTPKGPDGLDLSEAVHGPNATWNVSGGALRLVPHGSDGNQFNMDAIGQSLGFASLSCTVKGTTTRHSLELQVVP